MRAILKSHCISPLALTILLRNPLSRDDYKEFINERNRTFMEAIESLLIKQRLDLSPRLRELDERLENVELRIRGTVDFILGADPGRLPQHIDQRIEERVQAAARKNAAVDQAHFKPLSRRLEFCDLRDLQDIIVNKALWPAFEERFTNKEALATKFNQLAELRNGMPRRHGVGPRTTRATFPCAQ